MTWTRAFPVAELAEGGRKLVTVNGKEIGVFLLKGEYFAALNYCPHMGAPVCEGELTGAVTARAPGETDYDHAARVLRCPWHRWEFDLRTGRCLAPTKQRIRIYRTEIRGNELWVEL